MYVKPNYSLIKYEYTLLASKSKYENANILISCKLSFNEWQSISACLYNISRLKLKLKTTLKDNLKFLICWLKSGLHFDIQITSKHINPPFLVGHFPFIKKNRTKNEPLAFFFLIKVYRNYFWKFVMLSESYIYCICFSY